MSSPTPPAGSASPLAIRAARPEDYGAFVRFFAELWALERPAAEERWQREMMPHSLIAEPAGGPEPPPALGYAYFQVIGDVAYVRHLVTAPEARRRGVGRALMGAIAELALGRSPPCTSWCLNVRHDNTAAIALYEQMGMKAMFPTRALRVRWAIVDAAKKVQNAHIRARVIAPEEDARVEPPMRLLRGQLDVGRNQRGRVVLGLFDDDVVLGAAVFDPSFPGAYPFRVARPELAFVLLEALRPYARAEDELLNVVVEDQPEVADVLVAAGATVKLDTLHMSSSTIATAMPDAAER